MASSSHTSLMSNLEPPPDARDRVERKRSYRVPPPPAPIDIPEPVDVRRSTRRPPSPLRNSYTPDDVSEDGSDEDDEQWGRDPSSPSPSIPKLASEFAHRVGALVGSAGSRNSQHLPTQAELEAEAERERERSRREAEMIIRREVEERKMVEDGVFAMLEKPSQEQPLQPPPPRSQTMGSARTSPSSSTKEKENWFTAVKNKLTPTKEPLTPAQQIIHETKAKDKEKKKGKDREKDKDPKEWPATPSRKHSDPAFLSLAASAAASEPVTPPRPVAQNGLMTPSPGRSIDSTRDGPPLYAQFNSEGTLDVPETLLTVARRFEKLERWTVSHVRALEERMGDVERWLVEKEKEREEELAAQAAREEEAATRSFNSTKESEKSSFRSDEDRDGGNNDIAEIREELVELQGRVGELGREMARLMTAPLHLSSGPARNAAVGHSKYTSLTASPPESVSGPAPAPTPVPTQPAPNLNSISPTPAIPPTPASIAPRSLPTIPVSTPRAASTSVRTKESTSPPTSQRSSSVLSTGSGRTRLPYPTGDYTSPPGSIPTKQDVLSPTNSPPSSLTEATRKRPLSIAGLPSGSSLTFQTPQSSTSSTSGLPSRQETSTIRALSPNNKSSTGHSPVSSNQRQPNISPTPHKRYTVALGQPVASVSAPERVEHDWRQRATFSSSPVSGKDVFDDDEDDRRGSSSETSADVDPEERAIGHSRDDRTGKSSSGLANPPTMPNDILPRGNSTTNPPRESPGSRIRAQSSYGPPKGFSIGIPSATDSLNTSPSPIAPLRPRVRSKSIDRIGLGISVPNGNGRFVDPLVLKEQEPKTPRTPRFERGRKVPVGELVAFFDQERQR